MEGGLVKDFIETMGHNDNVLEFKNKYYFFNGLNYNQDTKIYSFTVYEVADKGYGEIIKTQFYYENESAYEAERNMRWLD